MILQWITLFFSALSIIIIPTLIAVIRVVRKMTQNEDKINQAIIEIEEIKSAVRSQGGKR